MMMQLSILLISQSKHSITNTPFISYITIEHTAVSAILGVKGEERAQDIGDYHEH
jgi:hypothetical protein